MTIHRRRNSVHHWLTPLLLVYVALAVYGSLYPFADWTPPRHGLWTALAQSLNGHHSRADLVVNLLVYMPIGLILALRLRGKLNDAAAIALATAAGTLLSLAMETLQLFLPLRTTSLADLMLNSLGSVLGAATPLIVSDRFSVGRRLHGLRERWIEPGPVASFGLLVIGVWALSQLTPFVPSLDIGNLRAGLSPLYGTLRNPSSFDVAKALAYVLALTAVGLLGMLISQRRRPQRWHFAVLLLAGVLILKIPIIARSLSAEAAAGFAIAAFALWILERAELRQLIGIAAFAVIGAYTVEQLRPIAGATGETHWQLFSLQMLSIHGLQDILAGLWPFMGLAYLACRAGMARSPVFIAAGAAGVAVLAAGLEWVQLYIPGRHPDATDVLLAAAGWTLPWLNPALKNHKLATIFR